MSGLAAQLGAIFLAGTRERGLARVAPELLRAAVAEGALDADDLTATLVRCEAWASLCDLADLVPDAALPALALGLVGQEVLAWPQRALLGRVVVRLAPGILRDVIARTAPEVLVDLVPLLAPGDVLPAIDRVIEGLGGWDRALESDDLYLVAAWLPEERLAVARARARAWPIDEVDPHLHPMVWLGIGHLRKGELALAEDGLEQAAAFLPPDARARVIRGLLDLAARQTADPAAARRVRRRALALLREAGLAELWEGAPPPPIEAAADFDTAFRQGRVVEATDWLLDCVRQVRAAFPEEGSAIALRLADHAAPDLATDLREAAAASTPWETPVRGAGDDAVLAAEWSAWLASGRTRWPPWRVIARIGGLDLVEAHATEVLDAIAAPPGFREG